MNKINVTETFVDILYERAKTDLTIFEEDVRSCFLDYLGCAFAGVTILEPRLGSMAEEKSLKGEYSVFGGYRCSLPAQIYFNAFCAHAPEMDDGHRFGMLHPGAPVFSALLPLLQDGRILWEDFRRGIVIGYEATVRLARAVQPSHKLAGFHATGTCGTVGAACAVASALNYTRVEWKNAVSAAAYAAGGLLEAIDDGSEMKPANVARAAMDGYMASTLGKHGFRGSDDALGGERGFLKTLAKDVDVSQLSRKDMEWAIKTIYRKPYAACRHCHSPIEAVLKLREREPILLEDIVSVEVDTYALAVRGHEKTYWNNGASAKMSTPYGLAAAWIYGNVSLRQYDDQTLREDRVKDLAEKVTVKEDPELTTMSPKIRGANVQIKLKDGRAYSHKVYYPKGEPENPMSKKEVENKFISLAEYAGKTPEIIERIIDLVMSSDFQNDMKRDEFFKLF